MASEEEDTSRRLEELEALQAFYGNDIVTENPSDPAAGPWTVKIGPSIDLNVLLPIQYPSRESPTPLIRAPSFVLNEEQKQTLEEELLDMYQEDTEVVIMWAEHLRASLGTDDSDPLSQTAMNGNLQEDDLDESQNDTSETADALSEGAHVFHPYSNKFGQPVRSFDAAVISDQGNRRTIHRGKPFHPPRSGPAETMVAHVASVESMSHVNWVLGELLLNDKKVAKANHNMIAYRFFDKDRGCLVSDNDDDGEKGAGAKLAALLEMADVRDVIVIVSRWFGGVHLGPARFKYFASTARDALEEAGFLSTKK